MSLTLDDRRDVAAIHPLRFWTEYVEVGGQMQPADWVEWVKKGDAHGAITGEKIARAKRDASVWAVVRPHYEAWKAGQDAVTDGTPLDAVPFATKELCAVLARVHIRSVEDLAAAEDAALARLNVPGIRAIQGKARAFLDAQANMSGVSAELAALRAQVEALTAEKAEAEATAATLAGEAGRRKRSRDEVMAAPGG